MKASGSYGNLVQGVSQQAPQDRRDGQVGEMVNMIPDPVNGLSRRHGSKWVAERDTGLAAGIYDILVQDTAYWRRFEYSNGGKDFVVMFRTGARPLGSTMPSMVVYDRTSNIFIPVVRHSVDAVMDTFDSAGCSAIAAVGKYVFAAGHGIVPEAVTTDLWGAAGNQDKTVVWIRGGGYSRTFKVSAVKLDNTVVNFSYTTPKSSYSGVLDTTGVPQVVADPAGGTEVKTEGAYVKFTAPAGPYYHDLTWGNWTPTLLTVKKGTTIMTNVTPGAPANSTQYAWAAASKTVTFHSSNSGATDLTVSYTVVKTVVNPNYAQIVGELTNAYTSAVTKHIGDAAEAIQPQAIAEQLKLAAVAAGLTLATRQDSTIIIEGVKSVTAQDGGDGSLIRGVANEVASADQVSNLHLVGKVVKVRARGSEEAFYLKASPKDPNVISGYTEVTWNEGAGVTYSLSKVFILCVAVAGTFYMASSASILNSLTAGSHPTYSPSSVGDSTTSPIPFFVGRKITYIGVFQDRLLIGSGSVVRASRIGDYLNFFRTSVLTAPANDAFEMLSQGSEDDELRHSVLYDRDIVLFGLKRQYAASGRSALSPSNANLPVMSSHEGAADVPPVAAGGLIFYSKQGEQSPSVHEIRPGAVAESPESYSVSSQLTTYFKGTAVELATIAKPSMLFVRTSDSRNSIYPFTYLDTSQGRRQDAWGRWDFAQELGVVFGMLGIPSGLLVFSLRLAHGKVWVVADVCPVTAELASYPYLDSARKWDEVATDTGSLRTDTTGTWNVAFDASTDYRFLGGSLSQKAEVSESFPLADGMWAGAKQDSYFVPTNPFVKDRKEKAVLTGRLTVSSLKVSYSNSSGFDSVLSVSGVDDTVSSFAGYSVGGLSSLVSRAPVVDGSHLLVIGRETRDYKITIKARTWLPFTVSSVEWVGQSFNNPQRLG